MTEGVRAGDEMPPGLENNSSPSFFAGPTEMHERINGFDWSLTPVGPMHHWPQSLKTQVQVLLASQYPIVMTWGPEYTQIYNDAYSKIIGDKHPEALGTDLRVSLAEVWDTIGPMIEEVLQTGVAKWSSALPLVYVRSGYEEETFFSVSHSPALDETGRVRGLFCLCTEITQQVLAERRLNLLRDLSAQGSELRSISVAGLQATFHNLAEAIQGHPHDVPFALFYQRTQDDQLELREQIGNLGVLASQLPQELALDSTTSEATGSENSGELPELWHLLKRSGQGETLVWSHISNTAKIPGGPMGHSVEQAMVLPIAVYGQKPLGVLVAGINPNRALDEAYALFYELLIRHVTVALSNAQAYEAEHQRAEALAQLNRTKTEFFNNVSHEFRTPLTLMLGPLESLLSRSDATLGSQDREELAMVHRNSVRLLRLVNNLLSFSRVEAQRVEAWFQPTDLAHYTTELCSVFGSATDRAGLRLRVECDPLPEPVYIDREMWEKIVLNLLSNAFKFTFEGEIRVGLQWWETGPELTVTDTGIGIPPQELPLLFERFHRVRGARSRTQEGTGIGLALVQELVRLHKGQVEVSSQEEQGSTFTVRLLRGFAHLPATQVDLSVSPESTSPEVMPSTALSDLYKEDGFQWLPEQQSAPRTSTSAGTSASASDASPLVGKPHLLARQDEDLTTRILLVDDNAEMRDYLSRLLSDYIVDTAVDGVSALELTRKYRPDLIITDVMMPAGDGFELLRELRADTQLRDVPIIILSARAGEEARIEGLERGADDYLVKPFRARELLAKVEANLRTNLLRREASHRQISAILESITDGFYALDRNWRFVYINAQCEVYLNKKRDEMLGRMVWDVFPNMRDTAFYTQYHHAMQTLESVHIEAYSPVVGRWLDARAYPSTEGLSVYFRDITARREAEIERERLLREAQEANRVKDEFLAIVSHELRTPLNAITGWAHLLASGSLSPEDARHGLEAIERNAKAQGQIIEDILDVSRIVTGKMSLDASPMQLEGLLSEVLDTVRLMARGKSISLTSLLDSNVGWVQGDAARLRQVFWNLLSNAIKFTPAGGQVHLRLRRLNNDALVEVRDTGIGISTEFLPHVFDRFRQADMSSTRAHGGLGLGLAIVRQLVELHQGSIQASSMGKNKGSTFTVKLPLLYSQLSPEAPTHPFVLENNRRSESGPSSPTLPLGGVRVLVVDDQTDTRNLLGIVIRRMGAEVKEAETAEEVLEIWDEFSPDVLVSDIGMPEYDGYWLIHQIRAREAAQHKRPTPAIALTAYTQYQDIERALSAGFERHLPKPINPTELTNTIRELTEAKSPGQKN